MHRVMYGRKFFNNPTCTCTLPHVQDKIVLHVVIYTTACTGDMYISTLCSIHQTSRVVYSHYSHLNECSVWRSSTVNSGGRVGVSDSWSFLLVITNSNCCCGYVTHVSMQEYIAICIETWRLSTSSSIYYFTHLGPNLTQFAGFLQSSYLST